MNPHIVVVGAGAVGGYIGGQLARQGVPVTLIDAWPEHVNAIRQHGLKLFGTTADETHTVQVEALHMTDVQSLIRRRPVDIVICATKSYDTEWAATLIKPYLAADGFIVSAQNSVNEETIAGVVGWGRTVGCVVANNFGVDLFEAGNIRRTMRRDLNIISLMIGEIHGRVTYRAEKLRELFSFIDGTKVTTNLWGERWSKLCVNGMRNGVSAATGLSGNERDTHPLIRRVVIRLAGEAIKIGKALGYELELITGIEPDLLQLAAEGNDDAMSRVESHMSAASNQTGRSNLQRPSMAQDIMKGRRTEIDYINGLIVKKGGELNYAADTHRAIIDIVKRIELGEINPAPEVVFNI